MIREAVRDDIPHLVVMGLHFLRSGAYSGHLEENPDALFEIMLRLIESDDALLLVQDDGKPVGMLGAIIYCHPLTWQVFFNEIFWWVEPDSRGDGIALEQAATEWAKQHGATKSIMVSPDDRVSRLYERRGYTKLETHYIKAI